MVLLQRQTQRTYGSSVGPELLAALPKNPKPWYRTRHLIHLNLILLVLLFSSATVGFDSAMMNGLQALPQWKSYFNSPPPALLGIINAIYPIGKLIGLYPATWLSDRYGRRAPMHFGFFLLILGAAIQGGAQNLSMFIVARVLLGLATAFISLPSPLLICELAYPTQRGKMTALYNTFFYLGSVFAAWSTYGSFRLQSTWAWRIPSILQGAFPFMQLCCFYCVPESPRWLVAHGKHKEARQILTKYHSAGDKDSLLIDFELAEIETAIKREKTAISQNSYMDCVRTAPNRRRTFIAVTLGFFAQWAGNGVVSYYLTLVLDTIGIKATSSQARINGMLQLFNWIISVLAGALMVDRLGRRTLFLISAMGMLISYICWTVLNSIFARDSKQTAGYAVLAFIFIYYFFYDIAWTPLLWAYPAEIFPCTLRARGLTITLSSAYTGLILGQFLNPIAMTNLGWKYYIVFCCLLAALLGIVWFYYPETKGRTLEEIADIFDGEVGEEKESRNVVTVKHGTDHRASKS
ncbi:related to hexose transporter protein [Rhynchosporium secalis]|uniref:Related to hexose transporter protein n=1 Tax=Rhynchosporium secalis TaxID=38038 RepID=A0A1E1M5M6_RHYSE|nr:related to hexose transporter protein [Rhynchosporium secalis]